MTRREAAELADVHINTIRLWESTGRVTTRKAENGIVMIPRREIEAIVAHRREAGLDDAARIAALEAENRMLREDLDKLERRYDTLLSRLTELAGG